MNDILAFIRQHKGPGLYVIVNTVDGTSYVGQGEDVGRRATEQWRKLRSGDHDSPKLPADWDHLGESSRVRHQNVNFSVFAKPPSYESTTYVRLREGFVVATLKFICGAMAASLRYTQCNNSAATTRCRRNILRHLRSDRFEGSKTQFRPQITPSVVAR